MTFRNDHDAALARVDALEAEVEALQAQLAEERAAVKRLELQRLDEFLGQRDTLPPADPQDVTVRVGTQEDDPVGVVLAIVILFAVALFLLAIAMA